MAGHVIVGGVVPNGPAAKFGLQQGDIILTVEKKSGPHPPEALPGNVAQAAGRTDLFANTAR
jgi:C-terminal processing protease CtpA/Prc